MNYKIKVFWTIWAIGYHHYSWNKEYQFFLGPFVLTLWK